MNQRSNLLSCILFGVLCQCNAVHYAKGHVTAVDGLPFPKVIILVMGIVIGTITNLYAKNKIEVYSNSVFFFTALEHASKEVAVNGRGVSEVIHKDEFNEVDEVLVNSLRLSRKKKSLGFAVAELKSDAVNTVKIYHVASAPVDPVPINDNGFESGVQNTNVFSLVGTRSASIRTVARNLIFFFKKTPDDDSKAVLGTVLCGQGIGHHNLPAICCVGCKSVFNF